MTLGTGLLYQLTNIFQYKKTSRNWFFGSLRSRTLPYNVLYCKARGDRGAQSTRGWLPHADHVGGHVHLVDEVIDVRASVDEHGAAPSRRPEQDDHAELVAVDAGVLVVGELLDHQRQAERGLEEDRAPEVRVAHAPDELADVIRRVRERVQPELDLQSVIALERRELELGVVFERGSVLSPCPLERGAEGAEEGDGCGRGAVATPEFGFDDLFALSYHGGPPCGL